MWKVVIDFVEFVLDQVLPAKRTRSRAMKSRGCG